MKRLKLITTTLVLLGGMVSLSTVTFAGGGSETTEIPTGTAEMLAEDNSIIEITKSKEGESKPLTPDGNLTLVDDITIDDGTDKQFITAVTKNGNYFYLVIDRAGDKENVYLLNMVDEADLMALMEGKPVKVEEEPEELIEPTPVELAEPTEEPEKSKNNTLPILVLVLAIFGGGVFYYLKYMKKKKDNKGNTDLNEFNEEDYEDDEEEYELDEDDNYITDAEKNTYSEK